MNYSLWWFGIITSKVKRQGRSQLYSLRPFLIALSALMAAFYTFYFVTHNTLFFLPRGMQFVSALTREASIKEQGVTTYLPLLPGAVRTKKVQYIGTMHKGRSSF